MKSCRRCSRHSSSSSSSRSCRAAMLDLPSNLVQAYTHDHQAPLFNTTRTAACSRSGVAHGDVGAVTWEIRGRVCCKQYKRVRVCRK